MISITRPKIGASVCITFLLFFVFNSKHTSPILPALGSDYLYGSYAGIFMTGGKQRSREWKQGAVIAAAREEEDVSWMDDITESWVPYPYNVDDPDPPSHLQLPANKGHEAMVYLSFIIDNWDDLPPRAIFVHGHRESWHQEAEIVTLIQALKLPALETEGYVPLRCDWYPSCPSEIRPIDHDVIVWGPGDKRRETEDAIGEVWDTLFPGVELPETIAGQCCAQFAVTKKAIQRRSKADYERIRNWVLKTDLTDDISGRVLEKLWAYIMTHESVHCPAPQRCACEFFGHCGRHRWSVPPRGLGPVPQY